MDTTTPPYHRSETQIQTKSASRLSKLHHYNEDTGSPIPKLTLDTIPCSSPKLSSPSPNFSPKPLRELLLLSPSPLRKSKARLAERCIDIVDEGAIDGSGGRKRSKSRCATSSPRNYRRSRKRVENEDKEVLGDEGLCKPRKKRNSGRSKKDKSIVIPSVQSSATIEVEGGNFERFGEFINDLVMWRDVSKSTLWFGFGSLCFLSSCFTKGVNFSTFSFVSQLGFLFLGISFLSSSIRPRNGANEVVRREFKLTEEDILKAGRLILPVANFAISKTRQVFSGEPDMTLKVLPFFLLGAEYGHLITLWRLSALSFFISFTGPRLYSAYSPQISNKVENLKTRVSETWEACTHKKFVSASIVTAFWNFTSVRTRIFAAFLGLVVLRYRKQHSNVMIEEEDVVEKTQEQQSTKETVADKIESKN